MYLDSAQKRTIALAQPPEGFMGRLSMHVRQFFCGLGGHDSLRHFERGRMSLKCVQCGHETPGWEVGPPTTRRVGKQPAVSVRLVGQRRAA
jgi:hypothetical protein